MTADEILNKYFPTGFSKSQTESDTIEFFVSKAMEEYAREREKEAADKAWEAGVECGLVGYPRDWNDARYDAEKAIFLKVEFPEPIKQ